MKITKKWKFLPVMLILGSILLSACAGFNLAMAAPTTTGSPTQSAAQATVQPILVTGGNGVQALQSTYEDIYQQVNPSVVNIQISAKQPLGFAQGGQTAQSQPVPVAEGSGFVWDTSGHIVTNNHVIDGADLITVTFADGTTAPAKLVGTDPNSDLAVIQVNVAASELTPVKVANSADVQSVS